MRRFGRCPLRRRKLRVLTVDVALTLLLLAHLLGVVALQLLAQQPIASGLLALLIAALALLRLQRILALTRSPLLLRLQVLGEMALLALRVRLRQRSHPRCCRHGQCKADAYHAPPGRGPSGACPGAAIER